MSGCFITITADEDDQINVTAHRCCRDAHQQALEWIQDTHPRARVGDIDELRDFECEHDVMVDFYYLDFDRLSLSEV